ncbi:DNA damage-binding protein 2-like [Homalodisca vitripennis]|nr:DNA damage-binding protein 2-like [Homalodisca vitripennis]
MDDQKKKLTTSGKGSNAKENKKSSAGKSETSPRKRHCPTSSRENVPSKKQSVKNFAEELECEKFFGKNTKLYQKNFVQAFCQHERGYNKSSAMQRVVDWKHKWKLRRFHIFKKMESPDKRVSAIQWHPSKPSWLGIGGRTGTFWMYNQSIDLTYEVYSSSDLLSDGIQGIGFNTSQNEYVYTVSNISLKCCNYRSWKKSNLISIDEEYNSCWLTCMDVHRDGKSIYVGDDKGGLVVHHLDSGQNSWREGKGKKLHTSKIRHLEFNPQDANLMVTASLDKTVKLWDIRMLDDCVQSLQHGFGVAAAKFSRTNGCYLLSTDMSNELRVYKAPLWRLEHKIEHEHRFIPSLTHFKASWHPLADLFLVGSFPDIPIEDKLLSKELRGVDVYSAKTGRLCHQLTESRLLISLCEFNCAGQVLATSASRLGYVSLWHQRT